MVCAPTGSGKTIAYLFPILVDLAAAKSIASPKTDSGIKAVVLCPTRELARQVS